MIWQKRPAQVAKEAYVCVSAPDADKALSLASASDTVFEVSVPAAAAGEAKEAEEAEEAAEEEAAFCFLVRSRTVASLAWNEPQNSSSC